MLALAAPLASSASPNYTAPPDRVRAAFRSRHPQRGSLAAGRGGDSTWGSKYRRLSTGLDLRFVRRGVPSRARGLLLSASSRHSKQRPWRHPSIASDRLSLTHTHSLARAHTHALTHQHHQICTTCVSAIYWHITWLTAWWHAHAHTHTLRSHTLQIQKQMQI